MNIVKMIGNNHQPHSPYLQGNVKPNHRKEIAHELLKFNAWVGQLRDKVSGDILVDYDKAVEIIKSKRLVLGEPAVVPIIYTHLDGTTTTELVFGIGSADEDNPFIHCSVNNSVLNEAIVEVPNEETESIDRVPFIEFMNDYMSKGDAINLITELIGDVMTSEGVLEKIINAIVSSDALDTAISEKLRWRPISEILEKFHISEQPDENIEDENTES